MRVVTYSRVSTEQQTQGQSLANQDRKFATWCSRGGHTIVRSYAESASAGSLVKRRLFAQMLDDLTDDIECIVVDTADRLSRNLEDAFAVIQRLRERKIAIWPLDWGRTEPPDTLTYDSDDYLRLRDEIIGAQLERKRIKKRVLRSYEGRRERGAVTSTRSPFGLRREGDAFVPNNDAWVIAEIDRRFLAGDSYTVLLEWARSVSGPQSWGTRTGLRLSLTSPHYVNAGIRSTETQNAITEMLAVRSKRFGARRVHEHEFTGVFICGRCLALGFAPQDSLMGEQLVKNPYRKTRSPALVCQNSKSLNKRHRCFCVALSKVVDAWWSAIDGLSNGAARERWRRAGIAADTDAKRRALLRRVGELDRDAGRLKTRRDRAFDLLSEGDAPIVAQAKRMLAELEGEEVALAAKAEAMRAQLAALETTAKPRDAGMLEAMLQTYRSVYGSMTLRERNIANQKLCMAIESRPIVSRDGNTGSSIVRVEWPGVLDAPVIARP